MREAAGVLRGMGRPFEIVVVDDGSTDSMPARLKALQAELPELRLLRLAKNSGQSAALGAAFQAARGDIFITLDADGQNDPADIPALVARLDSCDLCCGYRAKRQDTWSKRYGSRWPMPSATAPSAKPSATPAAPSRPSAPNGPAPSPCSSAACTASCPR